MSEIVPPLVSTEYVEANLSKLTLVDATWYLPALNKDGFKEFQQSRLPSSKFLSLLELRDKSANLPNMLPSSKDFSNYMESIKISTTDHIVLYDQHGIFSAPRAFWILKTFNHKKVSIMNGGLPKWVKEGRKVINGDNYLNELNELKSVSYPEPELNSEFIADYNTVLNLAKDQTKAKTQLIDARPNQLYEGGHISSSKDFSFDRVLKFYNGYKEFKSRQEIQSVISEIGLKLDEPLISYCAIAMTACVVFFAIKYGSQFEIDSVDKFDNDSNLPSVKVYDGSWAEYSKNPESIIS